MRTGLIVLWMLLCSITSVAAQVNVDIGLPGVNIGLSVPAYPNLVVVPGYPVYYAPQVNSNYFFYDGMYWVYQGDNWYTSSWYNGPWDLVGPEVVPLFVLRIPVRYYRHPPTYFHGWSADAAPRWGDHWGNGWAQSRNGWDDWNHSSVPAAAPLPVYQRQYSGNRYPHGAQQQALQSQNYRYQPQETVVRQHVQAQPAQAAPAPSPKVVAQPRTAPQQNLQGSVKPSTHQQAASSAPHGQPNEKGDGGAQKTAAKAPAQRAGPTAQPQERQPQQAAAQHERKAPQAQAQDKGHQQAKTQAPQPNAQSPQQRPQQAAAPHEQKAPKAQGEDKGPQQTKGSAQEPRAQQQTQRPLQQAAAQREQQQVPKAQAKAPAQEPAQHQEKNQEKGEQQAGEHNK